MPSTSYFDADGQKKWRSVQQTGTEADPFVADVRDVAGATSIGGQSDPAATTTTQNTSLIGLFKGFWTAFGLVSQSADSTGTLLQRIRAIADRQGNYGDTASSTGSMMGQLRLVAESHQSNRITNTTPISISAAGNSVIITPSAGKSLRLLTLYFIAASAVTVTFRRGNTTTSVAMSGGMTLTTHAGDFDYPLCLAPDEQFLINLNSAVAVNGYIVWFEV